MHIRTKPPVLRHIHSISHICRRAKSLGVATEYPLSQFIRSLGELNGIPFALESLQNIPETGKNIEIGGGSYVSLVRWKTKQNQRKFNLLARRRLQICPAFQ